MALTEFAIVARQVRQNIGLVGQYAAVDEVLTGRQNLIMVGQLSHLSGWQARQRFSFLSNVFLFGLGGGRFQPGLGPSHCSPLAPSWTPASSPH